MCNFTFRFLFAGLYAAAVAAEVASVVSDSGRPHRRQPTRLPRPWDSPGKNTGVGCHFLLQCMKVKGESEVTQSCLTLSDPMDCSPPGSSIHGFSRQEYWSGVPLPSPRVQYNRQTLGVDARADLGDLLSLDPPCLHDLVMGGIGSPSSPDPTLPIRALPHDLCHGWDLPCWRLAVFAF